MHRFTLPKRRNDDGFTLIELLVVVVIIGILIGIAIPVYLNYRKSANDKSAQSDVRNAVSTLEICYSETGGYPTAIVAADYNANNGICSSQRINTSTNTVLTYSGTAASYKMVGINSGGAGKYYCYSSAAGGQVKDIGARADATAAIAACS